MRVECLRRDEMHRLPEFGGLFIRDTTNVDHYTFEFARRASAEGLVVIDDPESILKCTNKVFLQELLDAPRRRDAAIARRAPAQRAGGRSRRSACRAC